MKGTDQSSVQRVESRILLIRGERVLIDSDLAELYGVNTKRLNEQVSRNETRFPPDFAFRLTRSEKTEVVAKCDHLQNLRFSPFAPRAFTEHGAIMAANILNSPSAVQMSVYIVRAFVRIRRSVAEHEKLIRQLDKIESHLATHDSEIENIVNVIRQLLTTDPVPEKRRIGFLVDEVTRFRLF